MNSKHAPGPWFVTGLMTKYVCARIGSGGIQEVAAVGPTEADNGYGEQQLANAKLIAAAPDLLEALEDLVDSRGMGDLELARKAIAYARGEV